MDENFASHDILTELAGVYHDSVSLLSHREHWGFKLFD